MLTSRLCAMKIMKEHSVNTSEKLEIFLNEVRLISSCNNTHVINILAVSVTGVRVKRTAKKENIVYYVMPYAKNGEFFQLIALGGRLEEKIARNFFLQILQGI